MILLDGKAVAKQIREELKEKIKNESRKPILTVIMVDSEKSGPSQIYVRNKIKAAEEVGIDVSVINIPKTVAEDDLIKFCQFVLNRCFLVAYNERLYLTDGLIVQLPLPDHIDEHKVLNSISPRLDVDGFHAQNAGLTLAGKDCMKPCTAYGIMRLLEAYNIDVTGKKVKIINRSMIVGKPLASLMLNKNATVTVLHSKSLNIKKECRSADIIVTGVGTPNFIKEDYIKKGAVVVDVSINRVYDGFVSKICGDVDFENVAPKTSYITPVPGGVGPMTIAMLMEQTYQAYLNNK